MIDTLDHEFIVDIYNWLICTKCNLMAIELKNKIYFIIYHNNTRQWIELNLTCNEFLIKKIIE